MSTVLLRSLYALILATLLVCAYYTYTAFYGKYYFVMASRGARNAEEHEQYLRNALRNDPSFGYANQTISRLLIRQQKYGAALDYQTRGMLSFRPVRSYQQLGSIYEKLGRLDDAEQCFASALQMNPRDSLTLKHLAVIALERGASSKVNEYTARILEFDLGNMDVYYLRGRDAERTGNMDVAYANYQRIAAALSRNKDAAKGTLFSQDEIAAKLKQLSPQVTTN